MAQGAPLDEVKKQLSDLKKALGLIQVAAKEKEKKADGRTGKPQDGSQQKERLLLKTGYDGLWFCRDVLPRTYRAYHQGVFHNIRRRVPRHPCFRTQIRVVSKLAMRYDHTVLLARYLIMWGGATTQHKLWQIWKVHKEEMFAELLNLLCNILSKRDADEFTIKLKDRKILDGIFEVCGVPADKIRGTSSAVDKLDNSLEPKSRKK